MAVKPLVPQAATRAGWWVRIDTGKTEVSSVSLEIGTSKKDRRDWRTWHSNESPEFDVPPDFLNVQQLYIHGTANPNDRDVWFGVYYRNRGVKHFDFDDNEWHEMQQTDSDDEVKV